MMMMCSSHYRSDLTLWNEHNTVICYLQGSILCYGVHYVMYLSQLQCQFWSILEWAHHHHLLQGDILCYSVHYVMYLSRLQCQIWSIVEWPHHHHLIQVNILCYSVHYVMYLSKLQCQFWSIVEWTHHRSFYYRSDLTL
jgi:hypothetical protein